ncbi:MAG: hypothetical protein J6A07_02090 [Firmicutes bacterium]|nr:hypothetical protein [Bacillota bacterium]
MKESMKEYILCVYVIVIFAILYIHYIKRVLNYFVLLKTGIPAKAFIKDFVHGGLEVGAREKVPLIEFETQEGHKTLGISQYSNVVVFPKNQNKMSGKQINIHYNENDPNKFVIDGYDLVYHIISLVVLLIFSIPCFAAAVMVLTANI